MEELDAAVWRKAIAAYKRSCTRNGAIFLQPSEALSEITDRYICLQNTNGVLAEFDRCGQSISSICSGRSRGFRIGTEGSAEVAK